MQQQLSMPGKIIALALATVVLIAAAAPAFSQEAPVRNPPETNDYALTIGGGVAYLPSYEGSDDYVATAMPVLRGKVAGVAFFTRGANLYVDAIPNDGDIDIQAGPVASLRFDRTGRIKDPQVSALGKLDAAIEVGGFVGIGKRGVLTSDYDNLSVRVAYVHDVSNTHDSYVITPAIEYGTPLNAKTYVGVSASAEYVGKGYAATYYSVTPTGSLASGLPVFDADDAGFKRMNLSLFGAYSVTGDLTGGLSVFAVGVYGRMLGDAKRSPIVSEAGDADQFIGGLGVAYTF